MSWFWSLEYRLPYRWSLRRVLARFGYWEWEHAFKACTTGDRHCNHYHYRLGTPPS